MPASTHPTKPRRDRVPPRLVVHLAMRARRGLLGLADRLVPAPIALIEHAHSFTIAPMLAAMAELGIADHLGAGPKTAAELAHLVGADSDSLHRMLRAAAVVGLVRLDHQGRFHSTRLTAPLRRGHPTSAAEWCRYIGSASLQAAWCDLTETVRTGENAFRRVHGMDCFSWFDAHPEEGRRFAAGLGGLTRTEAAAIIVAYPFPHQGRICDVGGGAGILLGEILRARPGLTGVLVESPLVLAEAEANLESAGVRDRVELVEGDFFESIKVAADVYLLKWVLHDWDDDVCEQIVANVAAAMPPGARLVVVEGDQDPNRPHDRFSMIDAQMLITSEGGRERSGEQLAQLLGRAGLCPGPRRHTATDLVLVEATRNT